jgi:hypothetical protein
VRIEGNNIIHCQDIATQTVSAYHRSRLKRFTRDHIPPEDLANADHDLMLVDSIVEHIGDPKRRSQLFFRIRWKGYDESYDTWLLHRYVKDLKALDDYVQREIANCPDLKHLQK